MTNDANMFLSIPHDSRQRFAGLASELRQDGLLSDHSWTAFSLWCLRLHISQVSLRSGSGVNRSGRGAIPPPALRDRRMAAAQAPVTGNKYGDGDASAFA